MEKHAFVGRANLGSVGSVPLRGACVRTTCLGCACLGCGLAYAWGVTTLVVVAWGVAGVLAWGVSAWASAGVGCSRVAVAAKQNAHNDKLDAAHASLAADIQFLSDKITELQNTAGQITPEDQAILDALEARAATAVAKAEALDALTPPAPPTT